MASISTDKNGNRRILFVGSDKKRIILYAGKIPLRAAETIKTRVEFLNWAKINNQSPDAETARWLVTTEADTINKLAAVGLCERRSAAALGGYVETYVEGRTDVKPATKEIWGQGKRSLLEHFGTNRNMRAVTPGDADAYKLKLQGTKLAPMTVRKRLQFAKMVFRAALRGRLIDSDPFDGISTPATMPNRQQFISQADTAKLLAACPNSNWRAIVALARYGGLRCPSEVLSLKWSGVNWEAGRMIVYSPKTEHHPGKESRVVPLFPEMLPTLREAWEAAPAGAVYVVDEKMRKSATGPNGWRNCNLRQTFEKIVLRAGLKQWPRLFHNLRSSRQTELAETFPAHVVCAWLGNSEAIAAAHYLQVTDSHFERATHLTTQQGATTARNASQPVSQTS